ncbi:unnamed protein product [Darwinula stevensoni]|uniref:Nuclear transcription factor Y subunit beta n=1 Tax=Darwinula stevensoni TaxID=69355 RepID=A0A7R9A4R1_9CRUS|nr:unnamed protein product [Darwinula stevensoni]CAG0893033.1 unnamed protein product [Darwinula stevensoni]
MRVAMEGNGNNDALSSSFLQDAQYIVHESEVYGMNIAKDARECVQECVSEFISFITSEASDRCHQEKRKTINGEDILFAMSTLGFDNYVEPLKLYLQKYREAMKGEKALGMPDGYDDMSEEASGFSPHILTTNDGQTQVVYYQQYQLS